MQPPTQESGTTPTSFPLWYSLAERDRRWNAVRARAGEVGLDCIFVPHGDGIDACYLTELRGAVQSSVIVLPTDGREPIVITERGANAWVPEPRHIGRAWAEAMAQALLDAGMERARIGVVGLKGGLLSHVRASDGAVTDSPYEHVRQKLPNARFEDATDVVGFVRYVKSDEEIAHLQRATEIAESAVDEMIAAARPGVDAAVLYARTMERMIEQGSEYYPLAVYIQPVDGPPGPRLTNPPLGRRLQANDLITNEVSAVWGRQVSQEDQPILLGPIPEAWKPVIELQREVFEAGLERMKPGTTFGELIDFVNGFGDSRGMKTMILMHGRGYGDDGPLLVRDALRPEARDLRIEQNSAYVWKPIAASADGRIQFTWGGDVVVTESGGKPLFKRPHGMVSVG